MTKQINTGVAELLLVKVPDDSFRQEFYYSALCCYDKEGKSCGVIELGLKITRKYELLGIAHELTEEVWATIVDISFDSPRMYLDYDSTMGCGMPGLTATESGLSLLRANECYAVNPYVKPEFAALIGGRKPFEAVSEYNRLIIQFDKAQQNTGKWIALKRI